VFSHCGARASYKSGNHLFFIIGKTLDWNIGVANLNWKLTSGESYPVKYRIDQGATTTVNARVRSKVHVSIDLTDSAELFRAFRSGHVLTIEAAGERFTFSLKGSAKALAAARACVQSRIANVQSDPLVAGTTTKQGISGNKSVTALRAEATKFAANLLFAAGITGFRILDRPPTKSSYHAAWVAPGMFGRVFIQETLIPDEAVPIIAEAAAESSAKNCKGKLATMKLPLATSSGAGIKMVCMTESGKARAAIFIVFPRRKGGVYTIGLGDVGDALPGDEGGTRSASEDATDKLMNVDLKVLEP